MNYTNIASILNNAIMKNFVGNTTTIAENLGNIVELGTLVSDLTADQMKSFNNDLIVGVHNYVISRLYESKRFRILKDAQEYGGAIQRIMATDNFVAQDSHLLNLVSDGSTSYFDGKYYGMSLSSRVYTDTKAFKVVHSVSDDTISQLFTTAQGVADYFGLLEETEKNTITMELEALEKAVINKAIVETIADGRVINLLTAFNTYVGQSYTLTQIRANRDLVAYFGSFCKSLLAQLVDYIKSPSKKYNDGTVLTFSPANKIEVELLTQFATDIEYIGNPIEPNPAVMVSFDTIPAWQNAGTDMLPSLAIASTITTTNGSTTSSVDNVVGFIYDVDGLGITTKRNKIGVEPVGAESFTNYHHHIANNYFVDKRLPSVALVLE